MAAATRLTVDKLLFWLSKGYNVLLEGKHGVGKTMMIREAVERGKVKAAYFSAATMDPFIDFVGIPVKIDTADGSHIELILPEGMATGDIEFIFIDEFNRAHKKIRNAVMELIQFGTINGKPLNKRGKQVIVWAAINPDSDPDGNGVYDTDRLDPAQRDRFDIQYILPYDCDDTYFINKYQDQGKAAVDFWRSLPDAEKEKVSPRRLDKAIKMFRDECDLRDVIPMSTNPGRLAAVLQNGSAEKKLKELMGDAEASRRFLTNENNYMYALRTILNSPTYMGHFLPLLPNEKIALLFIDNADAKKFMIENLRTQGLSSAFSKPLIEVATANVNAKQAKDIREELSRLGLNAAPSQVAVIYNRPLANVSEVEANEAQLEEMSKQKAVQQYHRKKLYDSLERSIPQNMSPTAAKHVLVICGLIVDKTTTRILERDMPNLVKIGNFAITTMLRSPAFSVDQVRKLLKDTPRLEKYRLNQGAPTVSDINNYLDNAKKNAAAVANGAKLVKQTV